MIMKKKWLGRELNPRHEDFQSSALPTELPSLGLRKNGPLICTSGNQTQADFNEPLPQNELSKAAPLIKARQPAA